MRGTATKILGRKASFPGFIPPALATQVDRVPRGARWNHEIKFDGYRVQAH
jgi:bifunctional non-homologous end joining protein LigD